MITIFGSALGASWPLFMAAIPLATALLVYIFRVKGISHPTVTSTLFILAKLPSYQPSRRRFLPPLQFWLELIACILLALAASGLFISQVGKRIAVVVDTSKSMSALQGNTETRLATAQRIAVADVVQSAPYSTFAIFSADTTLTQRTHGGEGARAMFSAREAKAIINELPQSVSADRLASIVTPLISANTYDEVWIYTDKTLENSEVNPHTRVITIPSDPTTLNNVWIESLGLTSSGGSPRETTRPSLVAHISAVGKGLREGAIPVEVTTRCSNLQDGSSFSLPRVETSLRSGDTISTKLGEISGSWSYCVAQVSSLLNRTSDGVMLDNEAWIANSTTKNEVTLVSALNAQELGLSQVPFDFVKSEGPATFDGSRQAIYHRVVPSRASSQSPRTPSLIIFPPSGVSLWDKGATSRAPVNGLTITRWDESHPLLRYVKPPLISIPQAVTLTCPDSSQAIMHSSAGPLVCAGEKNGARYVITGFELLPFDGLKSPTISIFTLNALRWLFEPRSSQGSSSAGPQESGTQVGRVPLPPGVDSVKLVAPRDAQVVTTASGTAAIVSSPGILALRSGNGEIPQESLIAVNAFSHEESDIATQRSFTLPSSQQSQAVGDSKSPFPSATPTLKIHDRTQLESLLVVALLIVLCLDLVRRMATRARWGGSV